MTRAVSRSAPVAEVAYRDNQREHRHVNAAERFLAAARTHNVNAATAELAADVVMLNPATDDPVMGREAVAGALRAVEVACDEFRHTHLLSSQAASESQLMGLVFEARIGTEVMRGVDLLELDENDRISGFTVMARPLSALMALGARMSSDRQ
jgi:hypothetical protein